METFSLDFDNNYLDLDLRSRGVTSITSSLSSSSTQGRRMFFGMADDGMMLMKVTDSSLLASLSVKGLAESTVGVISRFVGEVGVIAGVDSITGSVALEEASADVSPVEKASYLITGSDEIKLM